MRDQPAVNAVARPATCDDELTGLVRPLDATGRGVRVGVIDSGWDREIDEPRVLPGVGLDAPGDGITLFKASDDDSLGHGTAAADVVLQVAPGVTIVPIRVFARRLETSPRVLVAAIDWATRHGLKLVNLSLGTSREDALAPLYVVCERARQAGVVLVAAASNRGHGWSYPAVLDPVLGVGHAQVPRAHDMVYRPEQALECGARATGQYVRGRDGRTRMVTGTSLAAPVVTGHVARLLEVHPNAGLDGVRRLLGDRAKRP